MNTPSKRYIFIDYENLKKIKIRQLEKVCDRIYILVNSINKSIPLKLVKKIQRLGSDVKWITAHTVGAKHVNFHIAFLMGKLHSKVDKDITFIVISNEESIDPMISCVNDYGRTCMRVTRDKPQNQEANASPEIDLASINADSDDHSFPFEEGDERASLKEKTIKETIRRLMNSDNPPTNLEKLKRYISRSNQEISRHLNIDEIIQEMINRKEIKVDKQTVSYTFLPA